MRLRTIELDQFRKFDRPVRIEGLRDGVNVLCGPNEHGKSTVLAALRAVLFERHNSRTEAIRGYQHHRGSTAPSVALDFEHDGIAHRIEKRFLSRPTARLVCDGTTYEGDAAEERLQRLLGVSGVSRAARDAAAQTTSIWGALLVDQGDSFAQAVLGEGARGTLSECLEAEIGGVSGGAAIGRLLKQVQASLAVLLDGHGKPRDRYKAAILEQEAADSAIASLQARRQVLEGDLAAIADARRSLLREEDQARAERLVEALAAARRHRDAVLGYRVSLEQADGAARLARSTHEAACAERDRRIGRAAALAEIGRAVDLLNQSEAASRSRVEAARAAVEGRRAAFDAAGRHHDEAERMLRHRAALLDVSERAEARDAAASRLARAEAASARVAVLLAELSRLRLDEDGLRTLHLAAQADRVSQAALQAQATTVELSLTTTAQLLVEGAPPETLPPGEARLSLTRPAELVIAGIGRLRIVPAARDQETLHASAQEAARVLRRGLDAVGCQDLAQAEQAMAERRVLDGSIEQARRALSAELDRAAPDIGSLRGQFAMLEAAVSERLRSLELECAPDRAAASADRAAASLLEEQAREASLLARDTLLAPDAAREIAETMLRQAEFDRRDQETECQRLTLEQARAEAAEPAQALAERLHLTAAALSERQGKLSALTASAPDGTPEMADAAIRRLEENQANRRERIDTLQREIAVLGSRIAREEGIGLDEQVETATRGRETAMRAGDDYRREAAILTLLRDTLLQADRAGRERYLAPLMTRLSPYLTALFPRARLSLREDFLITGLSRLDGGIAGADAETFDCLSYGTREQIAILSRLAFADMLLQSGKPAFLVLDDALAFADPTRMERMFDILADAGSRMQILVLTCREDVAAGLGGTRVSFAEADVARRENMGA